MAGQRFYWLKLMSDFFTQPKIKKLRRIAGGDTYTVIYLKMQLLSLKNGGIIPYEGIEETFADELALTMDETPENVQATLIFMESQGLIEKISEEEFFLPETALLIDSEAASTIRSRKHREKKKLLALQCNTDETNCNGDIEKDIEKELDTESDIEKEGCAGAPDISMPESGDLQRALDAFVTYRKESKKPLTADGVELIRKRLDELAKTDAEKVAILNQSIRSGWKDVFPLKKDNTGKPDAGKKYPYGNTKFCNYKPSTYDLDAIEQAERELRAAR